MSTAKQYEDQIKRMKLLAKSQTTFLKSSLSSKIGAGAALVKKCVEVLTEVGGHPKIEEIKSGLTALKLHELDVDVVAAEVELKEEISILRKELERVEQGGVATPLPPPPGGAPLPPPPSARTAEASADEVARLKAVEAENASLRNLLQEAKNEVAKVKESVGSSSSSATTASKESGGGGDDAALRKQLKEVQAELASAKSSASSGESLVTQLKNQLKQVEADSASKISSLEQSLNSAASGKGGVEAEVGRLNSELSKAQAALEKVNKEAAQALSKKTEELNALMAQKIKELETEKEEMMEAVSQEIDEVEKAKLSELEAMEKSKSIVASELAAKVSALAELEKTRASELAALEKSKSDEIASLKADKTKAEETMGKLRNSSKVVTGGMVAMGKKMKAISAEYKKNTASMRAELNEYKSSIKTQLGGALVGKINSMQEQLQKVNGWYLKELAERKKLHNVIQELKGNIRVFMRCRPPTKKEIAELGGDGAMCVSFPNPGEVKVLNEKSREKSWEFDEVFGTDSQQVQVYREVSALVTSVLDGFNVCIFAYGQTGSGKTWTMQGPPEDRGVNLRALEELIANANDRSEEFDDTISLSILEVYNEEIHDLLVEGGSAEKLDVRQSERGNYVPNLTSFPVASMRNVMEALAIAERNRSVTATNMNEHSSRSHMMLQISMTTTHKSSGNTTRGKLNLVDLAGSERINKSGATGQALKEAQNINQSLSALGDVIAARANKAAHIPFRNSKLTYLLQVRENPGGP